MKWKEDKPAEVREFTVAPAADKIEIPYRDKVRIWSVTYSV